MKLQTKNRFKQFFLIIIGIAVVFIALNYLPVKPIDQHPFFNNEQDAPLVIAHRAGDQIAPGNTMTAIKMSSEMGVDMIEVDLHITKDGQIVLAHDPTVDRTTDGTGYVSDYTLDEFLALDAGFHFQNTEGEYAFKGIGVYKPTLREVFDRYPDMNYMLEVKHTNPADVHQEIVEELWYHHSTRKSSIDLMRWRMDKLHLEQDGKSYLILRSLINSSYVIYFNRLEM